MKLRVLTLVLSSALLAACARSVDVVLSLPPGSGLQEGDAVLFEASQIGKVAQLKYGGERTIAVLALDPDRAKVLRKNAAAMVVATKASHLVEIYNSASGDISLSAGDELLAIDSQLELLAWRAGEALDETNQQVGAAISSLQEYFSSPEWEQKKQSMASSLLELEHAVGRSSERMEAELESLMNSLEGKTKETAEQLDLQYQQLKADLSKLGNDLVKQGQEHLLPALDNLSNLVREALEKYQHDEQESKLEKQSS